MQTRVSEADLEFLLWNCWTKQGCKSFVWGERVGSPDDLLKVNCCFVMKKLSLEPG